MVFLYDRAQTFVNFLWREAFISTAVDHQWRVASVLSEIIFSICKEHPVVIRIRTICRICKPEVLPYHDTVTVASLVKLNIASLAHPVTHDCEIHVSMVVYGNIIFTTAIVQVVLAESPVASASDESSTVDIKVEHSAFFISIHLSEADFEIDPVREEILSHSLQRLRRLAGRSRQWRASVTPDLIGCLALLQWRNCKFETSIIKILLTIAVRPPKTRIFNQELRVWKHIESYKPFLTSLQSNLLFKRNFSHKTFKHSAYRLVVIIPHIYLRGNHRRCCVRKRKYHIYKRILQAHRTFFNNAYVIPDAYVSASDSRYPVPSDTCVECRIVSSKYAAIDSGIFLVLFFHGTYICVL